MDEIREVRDNLEVVYEDMVKLLASNPAVPPRFSHESELRAAWYALLAARESLDRIGSALHPNADYPPLVVPRQGDSKGSKGRA